MSLRFFGCFAACFLSSCVLAAEPAPLSGTTPAAPAAPKKSRIFVLTQSMGFRHSVVTRPAQPAGALSLVEKSLMEIASSSGVLEAECSQDATLLTAAKLKELDALVFFTSGALPLKPAEFGAIQDWLRSGKAFVGIHSAADTFTEYRPYYEMLGATYLRHPWSAGAVISNLDPEHPAAKMFAPEFGWGDELCEYQYFEPRKVRVLLALNMEKSSPKVTHMIPVSWVREYGKGRVFYTNFGNSEAAWNDTRFRAHLLGGIRWALKLENGSAEPNTETQAKEDVNARLAVLADDKIWLTKAAKSTKSDPAAISAAATKLATEDKAEFGKLHDLILKARADEHAREAKLKKNQKPSDADVEAVQARRVTIISEISGKK